MANWEGVTEFVAVAETGGFTKAARKLSTSVAQVSRRVVILEERLGVKLLNRTTRKVALTEAGQAYFQQCRLLIEGLEQAELSVTQMQSEPRGELRVTAPATYGELHIAPLLNQFLQQYPQVKIDLILSNQKLDLIDSGIDVAVRLGVLESSTLIAKKLGSRQLFVCASPTYLSEHGTPQTLSDLKSHQCLLGSVEHWRFSADGQEKQVKVSGRLKCNGGIALLDAATQGLGIVQLPDYYVEPKLQSGELQEVLSNYRVAPEGIWAVYAQSRQLSLKVRLLIEFLSQQFAQ